MPTWLIVSVLVVFGAPIALRWYVRRYSYTTMLHLPMPVPTYAASPEQDVPAPIRDALAVPAAELVQLGFEHVGYLRSSELLPDHPRYQTVLRHPTEHVFALVGFSLSTAMGATVDFVTLFEDGFWLLTLNRRAHFLRPDLESGRVADAFAATLSEQWLFHRQGVAAESARASRRGEIDDVVRFREAFDAEEFRVGVTMGEYLTTDDPRQFRVSPQGAHALVARLQAGALRLAKCPPLAGVFGMRIPAAEQERKFQTSLLLIERRPKSRGARMFVLSGIAFAASMVLLTSWSWMLWVIPVVLFHELGHWVAMRAFGHRDATIRFIPFFGAATMTTKQFSKLSHEMVVLLAGPVPGMILGLALIQLSLAGVSSYALFAGIALVSLNVVNLLPLHPLDGGRILHALVTAGRPRFDLGLRVSAGVIFVIGAIVLKEPMLAVIGIVGLVFLRSGLRMTRLEGEVRRRPGFATAATPEARRALIFDVLSERGVAEGPQWLQLVRQLEVAIGHAKPTLTQALPWAAVYLGCLGGIVGYGAAILMSARSLAQCPRATQATPVTCEGGASPGGIDWTRLPRDSIKRRPFGMEPIKSEFPHAAFIWCTPPAGRDFRDVGPPLDEVRGARGHCAAFPWEPLPEDGKELRRRARWTLRQVEFMSLARHDGDDGDDMREHAAAARKSPLFDEETERLFKARDERGLSERIGRSPSESCKRLKIASVHYNVDEQSDEVRSLQIGVAMTSPDDLAPLTRYLCEAGCTKLDVLPFAPADPRLGYCFEGLGERLPTD